MATRFFAGRFGRAFYNLLKHKTQSRTLTTHQIEGLAMNLPGELIDHLTLLLETPTGTVEVDLGLFENPKRWYVVQLGQRVVSGNPQTVAREQIQAGMQDVGWPRVTKEGDA